MLRGAPRGSCELTVTAASAAVEEHGSAGSCGGGHGAVVARQPWPRQASPHKQAHGPGLLRRGTARL